MIKYSVIKNRYALAYSFCRHLLQKKYQSRGIIYPVSESHIQSIIAYPKIVDLIQKNDFDEHLFKGPLLEAIEVTRKELFPDLARKRFMPLDALADTLIVDEDDTEIIKSALKFEDLSDVKIHALPEKAAGKIKLLKKLYPDFIIPDTSKLNSDEALSENEIIQIYKNILLGIEKSFPVNFLKYDALNRSKVLVTFLVEKILCFNAVNIQSKLTIELLQKYNLSNICRFFNYSDAAVLHNAYPEIYPLWAGHCPSGFWDNKTNRIKAVKWLVEVKMSVDISGPGKIVVSEKDFILNGLSYLFKQKYNSVSRALHEAYPLLKPWQTGSLPFSYWNNQNAAQAINWMFKRLDWTADELPLKFKTGELNRKTFSQFGLAGLFEKKFNCSFFKAIDCAFPGKFRYWEFQNVSESFWRNPENIILLKNWLWCKNVDYKQDETVSKVIQKHKFYKSFYRVYKNIAQFKRTVNSINHEYSRSHKIYLRWQKLLSHEKAKTSAVNFLIYGFYSGIVKNSTAHTIEFVERKIRRLQRI